MNEKNNIEPSKCRRVSARFSSGTVSSFSRILSSIIRRARSIRADKLRPRKFLPKYVYSKINKVSHRARYQGRKKTVSNTTYIFKLINYDCFLFLARISSTIPFRPRNFRLETRNFLRAIYATTVLIRKKVYTSSFFGRLRLQLQLSLKLPLFSEQRSRRKNRAGEINLYFTPGCLQSDYVRTNKL